MRFRRGRRKSFSRGRRKSFRGRSRRSGLSVRRLRIGSRM